MHLLDLMAIIAVAMLAAKILGGLVSRVGIPSVLAELVLGIFIGNIAGPLMASDVGPFVTIGKMLHTIEASELPHSLSELGVLFLLFLVGLETDVKEIGRVGKDATASALAGVFVPFALAFATIPFLGKGSSFQHTLFIAATLTATSVGITARVLQETKKLKSVSGQIVLGAAVIDDILGILVLAAVSSIVTQGAVSVGSIAILLLKMAVFGLLVVALRRWVLSRTLRRIRPLEVSGTMTIFLLSTCLLVSWAAEKAGLAGIIGAFALGLALDDLQFEGYLAKKEYTLEKIVQPVADFFVPIFFIVMGMSVKLSALAHSDALVMAGVLIVCAVLGKLACGIPIGAKARERGADRLLIGFSMIPRGEVGLIFAAMGLRLKVFGDADYAAVVMMVAITTLVAPALIAWRARQIS